MKRSLSLAVFAAGSLLVSAVQAEGDAAAGRTKVETCLGCHGIPNYTNATPSYRVPKIAGQHAARIVAALQAYRSGERQHPTMVAQASTLSDQDMQDIAAWLAAQ